MENFTEGMQDADDPAHSITQETMGSRLGISVKRPCGGELGDLKVPYLMPPSHFRGGNYETVEPAIVHTPLGGLMPGPNAIPPAVVVGQDYRAPVPDEAGPWTQGIIESYPDGGCPIPFH